MCVVTNSFPLSLFLSVLPFIERAKHSKLFKKCVHTSSGRGWIASMRPLIVMSNGKQHKQLQAVAFVWPKSIVWQFGISAFDSEIGNVICAIHLSSETESLSI